MTENEVEENDMVIVILAEKRNRQKLMLQLWDNLVKERCLCYQAITLFSAEVHVVAAEGHYLNTVNQTTGRDNYLWQMFHLSNISKRINSENLREFMMKW